MYPARTRVAGYDDTAGTSQAATDIKATLNDFISLKTELSQIAPGSGLRGGA